MLLKLAQIHFYLPCNRESVSEQLVPEKAISLDKSTLKARPFSQISYLFRISHSKNSMLSAKSNFTSESILRNGFLPRKAHFWKKI